MFSNAIFDMDGTLWDAVDSYAEIWNVASRQMGFTSHVTRSSLVGLMGVTIDGIFNTIFRNRNIDRDAYLATLDRLEAELMPVLGGKLYPGVREGFKALHDAGTGIYLVSNCGSMGLKNFMEFTRLGEYVTDTLTYGETGCGKAENIRRLMERNSVSDAVYIGDTAGDCAAAHEAGIPMIHVTYGFGDAPEAEFHADSFKKVTETILK